MQMFDPCAVPNIDLTSIQRRQRLLRLIANIDRSETYDHAFVFHFCGTPGCACGHFLADPDLRAEFLRQNHDIDLPLDRSPVAVSPLIMKRVAMALDIPWRVFDDPSPYHDGTKAGVISCLTAFLNGPFDRTTGSPRKRVAAVHA